jgi:hypothetical protein
VQPAGRYSYRTTLPIETRETARLIEEVPRAPIKHVTGEARIDELRSFIRQQPPVLYAFRHDS